MAKEPIEIVDLAPQDWKSEREEPKAPRLVKFAAWLAPRLGLMVTLLLLHFLLSPNGTTKAAYCGLGFVSYCSDYMR